MSDESDTAVEPASAAVDDGAEEDGEDATAAADAEVGSVSGAVSTLGSDTWETTAASAIEATAIRRANFTLPCASAARLRRR